VRPRSLRHLGFCITGALGALFARRARALDAFEIQVYDGTANPASAPGLELHVNHVFSGAETVAALGPTANHSTSFTLEPSFGVFDFWELGAYLQTALRADGEFDYAGAKLRSKFVTPPGWYGRLRLGANFEFSISPRSYDPDRYGGELRPIVAWEDERWLFAVNPILDFSFAGAESRQGPAFEPCAMAKRKIGAIALGLEYYAGLGPIARPLPWRREEEYLYETIDLISLPSVEVDFGVGEGLSAASNALVAKLNIGYVWEPPAASLAARTTPQEDRSVVSGEQSRQLDSARFAGADGSGASRGRAASGIAASSTPAPTGSTPGREQSRRAQQENIDWR
jgi:hypothetical protein